MSMIFDLGRAIGRWLGLIRTAAPIAPAPAAAVLPVVPQESIAREIAVPAVAGFVMRAHVDRFLLSCRLASVSKLNLPHGRKPRIQGNRRGHLPAVPLARLGAKRTPIGANLGPRISRPAAASSSRPSAQVIPFPATAKRQAPRLARAA